MCPERLPVAEVLFPAVDILKPLIEESLPESWDSDTITDAATASVWQSGWNDCTYCLGVIAWKRLQLCIGFSESFLV